MKKIICKMFLFVLFMFNVPSVFLNAKPNGIISKPLFYIANSTGPSIVQYDLQLNPDGSVYTKGPVTGYWIRLADGGKKAKLKWYENLFAYGFKSKYNPEEDCVTIKTVADIKRIIKVYKINGEYKAVTRINNATSILEKFFVMAKGKGLSTKVLYLEFFGVDVEQGTPIYEKALQ